MKPYQIALASLILFSQLCVLPTELLAQGKKAGGGDAGTQAPPPYGKICEVSVYYQLTPRADKANSAAKSPTRILFATLSEQGMEMEDLKQRLKARVYKAQAEALQACREREKDEASCITEKIRALAADFPARDYKQRKLLLAAAEQDCKAESAICGAAEVSQLKCWLNVPPEVSLPDEPKYEFFELGAVSKEAEKGGAATDSAPK